MKKKFLLGLMALTASATLLSGCGKKDEPKEEVKEETKEENTSPESWMEDLTEDTKEEPEEDYEYSEEDEEAEYAAAVAEATRITGFVDEFLNALKAGDVEYILAHIDPDSDMVEDIQKMDDPTVLSDVFKIIYGDTTWVYPEEYLTDLADTVSYKGMLDADNEYYIDVFASAPAILYLDNFYFASLPAGTVLEEDFEGASEEDARQILEDIVKATPVTYDTLLTITGDGNGSYYIEPSFLRMDDLPWDDIRYGKDGTIFRVAVREILDVGSDITISDPAAVFEEEDEKAREMIALLKEKNLPEIEKKYEEYKGEKFSENDSTYDDLTDEQKAEVDEILKKDVLFIRDDHSTNYSQEYSGATFLCFSAVYAYDVDEDIYDWAKQNNVYVVEVAFDTFVDENALGLAYPFLSNYHDIIEFVEANN